ncbi:hypothetical protein JCM3770_007118 [Rhodotorula araucariae]
MPPRPRVGTLAAALLSTSPSFLTHAFARTILFDDADALVQYAPSSAWSAVSNERLFRGGASETGVSGATVTLAFVGEQVSLYGLAAANFDVSIDGDAVANAADAAARSQADASTRFFLARNLARGRTHRLVLRTTGSGTLKLDRVAVAYSDESGLAPKLVAVGSTTSPSHDPSLASSVSSPAPSASPLEHRNGDLRPEAIAGAVIGARFGVGLLVFLALLLRRRKVRSANQHDHSSYYNADTGCRRSTTNSLLAALGGSTPRLSPIPLSSPAFTPPQRHASPGTMADAGVERSPQADMPHSAVHLGVLSSSGARSATSAPPSPTSSRTWTERVARASSWRRKASRLPETQRFYGVSSAGARAGGVGLPRDPPPARPLPRVPPREMRERWREGPPALVKGSGRWAKASSPPPSASIDAAAIPAPNIVGGPVEASPETHPIAATHLRKRSVPRAAALNDASSTLPSSSGSLAHPPPCADTPHSPRYSVRSPTRAHAGGGTMPTCEDEAGAPPKAASEQKAEQAQRARKRSSAAVLIEVVEELGLDKLVAPQARTGGTRDPPPGEEDRPAFFTQRQRLPRYSVERGDHARGTGGTRAHRMTAPIAMPGGEDTGSSDSSPAGSPLVSSTSPPCIPHLPPAPGSAPPPTAGILLNPLPIPRTKSADSHHGQPRAGPSSFLPNPFKRADRDHHQPSAPPAQPQPQPGAQTQRKRTPSFTVEVYSPPPPAHFYQADQHSPPRIVLPAPGMRSRSVSPAPSPSARSPTSPGSAASSAGTLSPIERPDGLGGSTTTLSSIGSGNGGQSVKFAPLPPGRRAHRSNSLSIGVASRAKMIQSQGGAPNVRSARYAGPLQWYEGGPLPDDVYTWKDVQRGVTKLFKRVKGAPAPASSTVSDPGDVAGEHDRGRSAAVASSAAMASSSASASADEARLMEREAKGKSREIEHIEEAEEEDIEAARPVLDDREEIPATVPDDDDDEDDGDGDGGPTYGVDDDDDGATSASEVTAPRTPPEGDLRDGDLEVERRRLLKGKGVDAAEHRGVRVAAS